MCKQKLVFVDLLKLVDHVGDLPLNLKNQVLSEPVAKTHKQHAEGAVHFDELHEKRYWNLGRVGGQRLDLLF